MNIFEFISKNHDVLSVCVSIIVGFATIITSIATIIVAKNQSKLSEIQNQMQNRINQPIFEVRTYQTQDGNDGKYGTEFLEVNNVGANIVSCAVDPTAFFILSRIENGQKNSLYMKIEDYFYASSHDSENEKNIHRSFCPGNNRVFCEGYMAAVEDSKGSDVLYFFDKTILIKVEYKDIFGANHIVYYQDKREIDEEAYKYYFSKAQEDFPDWSITLNNIDYPSAKARIDELCLGK